MAYWAVGTGQEIWDDGAQPSEVARRTRTQLFTETGRMPVPPGQITFLGGTFTNRLEITMDFTTADIAPGTGNGGEVKLTGGATTGGATGTGGAATIAGGASGNATDGAGGRISRKQNIVCASAPYFKPKIDGNIADWADSIPVTFVGNGKKTVIRTYWTKRLWSVCVEVEESKLGGYRKNAEGGMVDAVQFALAVGGAETGSKPDDKANRYEFLIADCPGLFAKDKCFLLARPGEALGLSQEVRSLDGLEFAEAAVVVKRKGKTTVYECSIPFSAMPQIRPDTGREICFSVLVHDPDDTGIRDWGKAAGLWQSQRNKYAWCSWQGVKWADPPPYDNKIEWGLCSSKY